MSQGGSSPPAVRPHPLGGDVPCCGAKRGGEAPPPRGRRPAEKNSGCRAQRTRQLACFFLVPTTRPTCPLTCALVHGLRGSDHHPCTTLTRMYACSARSQVEAFPLLTIIKEDRRFRRTWLLALLAEFQHGRRSLQRAADTNLATFTCCASRQPGVIASAVVAPRRQKLHSNNSGLIALDEKSFTPPNIEARQSASGARSRSYTRGTGM